jgi:hypothetical protein
MSFAPNPRWPAKTKLLNFDVKKLRRKKMAGLVGTNYEAYQESGYNNGKQDGEKTHTLNLQNFIFLHFS